MKKIGTVLVLLGIGVAAGYYMNQDNDRPIQAKTEKQVSAAKVALYEPKDSKMGAVQVDLSQIWN